jgi:signal transduction histidine kinase
MESNDSAHIQAHSSDGATRIVIRSIATAPAWVQRMIAVFWIVATAMVIVEIALGFDGPDIRLEVAELLSTSLGMAGLVLLVMAFLLHGSQQRQSGCERHPFRFILFTPTPIMLALPAVGFLGGSLLMMAAGILIARAIVDNPLPLIAAAVFATYAAMVGVLISRTTRFLYGYAADQASAASRARSQAVEAQMAVLRAQMNPHFLFNTLNTVAALVSRDANAAERTVENLSSVLRRTLDRSRHAFATVHDEVDYLRAYLGIEQQRLGARLRIDWYVDAAAGGVRIPTMTLQPLVENALKYGVGGRLDGGTLRIWIAAENGTLRAAVEDDGPGFPTRVREGTGLGNLRQRLETLYGDAAALRIERPGNGSRVVVEMPIGVEA